MIPPESDTFPSSLPDENVFGHRKKLDFIRKHILEFIDSHPGRKIGLLDVGCSNGQRVTVHLGDTGAEITAIDIHEPSIEYAKAHNPYPETVTFLVADIDSVQADRKFDIVVLADILEHVGNPGELLESVKGRLNVDGIILLSIPNGYGPFEIENALDRAGCLLPCSWFFQMLSELKGIILDRQQKDVDAEEIPYAYESTHVQFWDFPGFKKLLKNHGLQVDEWRKGPWFGALQTSAWLGRSQAFCRWNSVMGDRLPESMVSTWLFRIVLSE